jgi:hypothetical protein
MRTRWPNAALAALTPNAARVMVHTVRGPFQCDLYAVSGDCAGLLRNTAKPTTEYLSSGNALRCRHATKERRSDDAFRVQRDAGRVSSRRLSQSVARSAASPRRPTMSGEREHFRWPAAATYRAEGAIKGIVDQVSRLAARRRARSFCEGPAGQLPEPDFFAHPQCGAGPYMSDIAKVRGPCGPAAGHAALSP